MPAEAAAVPEAPAEVPAVPAPPPPVSAPKADHVAYAAEALGVPAEEAEAMTKADLVDLTRSAPAAPPQSAPSRLRRPRRVIPCQRPPSPQNRPPPAAGDVAMLRLVLRCSGPLA